MNEKKIEFLVAQIQLGNIMSDVIPAKFREAVEKKLNKV